MRLKFLFIDIDASKERSMGGLLAYHLRTDHATETELKITKGDIEPILFLNRDPGNAKRHH